MDAKRKLATNPELRAELGEAELRRVEGLFDWNRKINRILDLYRESMLEYGRRLRPHVTSGRCIVVVLNFGSTDSLLSQG
jgi:hypothetical protein